MKEFALLTDSACALNKPMRERFGVDGLVYGAITYPDGTTTRGDLEWEKTTPEEYFGGMASKKHIYKTSCANVSEIHDLMESFAKQGKDILMIDISHALSGTYEFACVAAEQIRKEYPDIKVRVIDSLRYSTALGMLVAEANEQRKLGKSMEEVADWVEENKIRFHQMGIMDDMFFLARTGRVSKAKAFFGTMVGIEPMADLSTSGLSEVLGKAKGKKNALRATVDYVKATIEDPKEHILFICHSIRPKEAEYLRATIEAEIGPKEIIVSSVDQFCGANIGPGLAACFYYGKKASENLEEEKVLLGNILAGK